MSARMANSQGDTESVFLRMRNLEAEVSRLREENARLRGQQAHHEPQSPGQYSLLSAERAFLEGHTDTFIPPPPTYRELPAVAPQVPRHPQPPPRGRSAGPMPALDVGYVNRVEESQLDTLPYGLVVLDRDGRVLLYNETESRLTGFSRNRVLGKNFFGEVAPCTAVKEFEGVFRDFVTGSLGRTVFFDFAFHFSAGTQNVTIALAPGRRPGQTNVMMMRR